MRIQIPTDRTSETQTRATQMLTFKFVEICSTPLTTRHGDLHDINNLSNESSSLGILHTNLASLEIYHDDLEQILSLMKTDFQIIGITEHQIKNLTTISNI